MMPGTPHKASQPRRDPEDDAVDGFDRPTPSAPPPPETRRLQEPQTHSQPEHFDIGYDTAEEAEMPAPSSNGIISAISNGASNGANSFAADLRAGVVHALAYGTAVASAAVVKGGFRAAKHLATGNPLSVDDEEEEERSPEPMQAHPKAKAQAKSSWWGGSSGSQQKPSSPYPFPTPWTPEAVSAYNGVHEVSSGEEAPAPGPAAAARRPRNRGGLANRDLRFAQATLDADPNLGRRRR